MIDHHIPFLSGALIEPVDDAQIQGSILDHLIMSSRFPRLQTLQRLSSPRAAGRVLLRVACLCSLDERLNKGMETLGWPCTLNWF